MQANPYILHKIAMEHYIATTAKTYLIIRTSNLIGETSNPNTIANYLRHKVASGESFECWNIQRNLLNISHLCKMTNRLIEKNVVNDTVYLVNPIAYTVVEIVSCFEQILQKKANYTVVNKGANFDFPTDLSQLLFDELHISTEHYLQKNLA